MAPGDTAVIRFVLPGVIMDSDELIVTVHDPVTSVAEFEQTIAEQRFGSVLGSSTYSLDRAPAERYGEAAVQLLIDGGTAEDGAGEDGEAGAGSEDDGTDPSEPFTVALRRAGVYPVTVDLRTGDQLLLGRLVTHLARLPDGGSTALPVVLGVDLHAVRPSPLAVPDLTTVDTWLTALADHPVPVTLGITPALVDDLAGDTRLSTLRAIASRGQLVDGPDQRVDEAELVTEGLDAELDELDALGLRTLQSRLGVTPLPDAWLARDVVSSRRLEVLAGRGPTTAVVPSTVVQSDADEAATLGRARLPVGAADLTVLVSPSHMVDPLYDDVDVRLATAHLLSYWSVMALGSTRPDEVAAWFPWDRGAELGDARRAARRHHQQPPVRGDRAGRSPAGVGGRTHGDLRRSAGTAGHAPRTARRAPHRPVHVGRIPVHGGRQRRRAQLPRPARHAAVGVQPRPRRRGAAPPVAQRPGRRTAGDVGRRATGHRVGPPRRPAGAAAAHLRQHRRLPAAGGGRLHQRQGHVRRPLPTSGRRCRSRPGPRPTSSRSRPAPPGRSPSRSPCRRRTAPCRSGAADSRSGRSGPAISVSCSPRRPSFALGGWWILWVRSSHRQRPVDPGPGGADGAEWEDDAERELVAHDDR